MTDSNCPYNKAPLKHIIFDWDETLVHTLSTFKNAYDHVFDSLNLEKKSLDEIKALTGGKAKTELFHYMLFGAEYNPGEKNVLATKDGFKFVSPEQAREIANSARDSFYHYVEQNHLKHLELADGAIELLEYCKQQNINMHVLSSKSLEFLVPEIEAVGLRKYFTNLYGTPKLENKAANSSDEKPSLGSFYALFKGNPPKAEECCVIGDGNIDYTLAQNIGCEYIAVNTQEPDSPLSLKNTINQIRSYNTCQTAI